MGATETAAPRLRVSVLIPAYNAEATIAECLDSVLAQRLAPHEVIVVDDGSKDGTAGILERYAGRVTVISQANAGLARARNVALARATGEFVALMDHDDVCMPDRLWIQAAALARFPEAVACASDFRGFDATGTETPCMAFDYYSAIAELPGGIPGVFARSEMLQGPDAVPQEVRMGNAYPHIAFGNFMHPPTMMIRRDVLERAGVCDLELRYAADWEWFVRLARQGPFIYVPAELIRYRLSETQMTGTRTGFARANEVVFAAGKILRADPDLERTYGPRVRKTLAGFLLDSAYVHSQCDRPRALRLLGQAVRRWPGSAADALRIAARTMMPAKGLTLLRRVRRGSS